MKNSSKCALHQARFYTSLVHIFSKLKISGLINFSYYGNHYESLIHAFLYLSIHNPLSVKWQDRTDMQYSHCGGSRLLSSTVLLLLWSPCLVLYSLYLSGSPKYWTDISIELSVVSPKSLSWVVIANLEYINECVYSEFFFPCALLLDIFQVDYNNLCTVSLTSRHCMRK